MMDRFKLKNLTVRQCTALIGLFSLASLTICFYWSLEQPQQRLLEYFSLEHKQGKSQVVVSNILDIAYRPWGDDPECKDYSSAMDLDPRWLSSPIQEAETLGHGELSNDSVATLPVVSTQIRVSI
jgi:hypothetical protein